MLCKIATSRFLKVVSFLVGLIGPPFVVFIPKGDPGAGGVGVQARPGDLRPLSLSNAGQKLVALAISFK